MTDNDLGGEVTVSTATPQEVDAPPENPAGVEAQKPGDGAPDPGAPVQAEQEGFSMPQGFDPGDYAERFSEVAGELNLKGEAAEKLLHFWAEVARDVEEGRSDAWREARKGWARETMKDAEIGGQNLNVSVSLAAKAVNSFGTEGLKEVFRVTGLGNHPEVVRFMARVGRALAEDSFHGGAYGSDGGAKSAAELIYGKP